MTLSTRGTVAAALVGLCLLASAQDAQARRTKTARLRAMTFNIRFDFEDDGPNRWQYRADLVAQTIKASGAHVFCLQEDKEDQVEDLRQRLPDFEFTGKGRNPTGSGERCSIWWEKSRFRLKESGDFWLSDTPDVPGSNTWGDKYPRKVTWALLEARKSKTDLLVLNTHLAEGNRDELRIRGTELIARWLREHLGGGKRKGDGIPVLITGDFNDDAGSRTQQIFTGDPELNLRDAWQEAEPSDPNPGTYGGFQGMKTRQRIDWLVIGGPIKVYQAAKISDPIEGRFPSDHYPVFIDIEVF